MLFLRFSPDPTETSADRSSDSNFARSEREGANGVRRSRGANSKVSGMPSRLYIYRIIASRPTPENINCTLVQSVKIIRGERKYPHPPPPSKIWANSSQSKKENVCRLPITFTDRKTELQPMYDVLRLGLSSSTGPVKENANKKGLRGYFPLEVGNGPENVE
jgi:hypothetical protein